MIATTEIADVVTQALAGHNADSNGLHALASTVRCQNLLHARIMAVLASEPERLRAFCRYLQKRLESTHG